MRVWLDALASRIDKPETAALAEEIVTRIEDSMPDADGQAKKRAAVNELAKALDRVVDFRSIVPGNLLVGGALEAVDGPLFRLILGPVVEAAVRGLKRPKRKR